MSKVTKLYKVVICGDRNWKMAYAHAVRRVVKDLAEEHGKVNLLLIEGGAPGVDSLVKAAGHKVGVHVAEISALWSARGLSAGPQRNKMMAALEPDEVIGIHDNFEMSVGTKGMLDLAESLGIPWWLVEP